MAFNCLPCTSTPTPFHSVYTSTASTLSFFPLSLFPLCLAYTLTNCLHQFAGILLCAIHTHTHTYALRVCVRVCVFSIGSLILIWRASQRFQLLVFGGWINILTDSTKLLFSAFPKKTQTLNDEVSLQQQQQQHLLDERVCERERVKENWSRFSPLASHVSAAPRCSASSRW